MLTKFLIGTALSFAVMTGLAADAPAAPQHFLQGRHDEAIRQFQEALRLEPDYGDARRNPDAMLAAKAGASPPAGSSTNR